MWKHLLIAYVTAAATILDHGINTGIPKSLKSDALVFNAGRYQYSHCIHYYIYSLKSAEHDLLQQSTTHMYHDEVREPDNKKRLLVISR